MNKTILRSSIFLAGLSMLLWCAPASADISDNFDDGNDTDWLFTDLIGNGSHNASSGSYVLRGTAVTSVHSCETFTDASITADLITWDVGVEGGMSLGLVARYNPGTVSGYAITVDADGAPNLNFLKFQGGNLTGSSEGSTISGLDPAANDYILTLNISGSLLSASIANKTAPGTPLSSISWNDTTFADAGYTGFIVVHDALSAAYYPSATFDNFSAVAPVPEPSSLALVAVGALALLGTSLRRRRW